MRLRPIVLAVFVSAATSAAAPPESAPAQPSSDQRAPWCHNNNVRHAQGEPGADARRLGELPPGDLYLTVDRMVGRCRGPVLVREGYGATREERRR